MSCDEPVRAVVKLLCLGRGSEVGEEGETEAFGGDSADLDQTQQ